MSTAQSPRVTAFIEEIIAVCRKHGLSISHEDCHGGFKVEYEDEGNFSWLREALDQSSPMSMAMEYAAREAPVVAERIRSAWTPYRSGDAVPDAYAWGCVRGDESRCSITWDADSFPHESTTSVSGETP